MTGIRQALKIMDEIKMDHRRQEENATGKEVEAYPYSLWGSRLMIILAVLLTAKVVVNILLGDIFLPAWLILFLLALLLLPMFIVAEMLGTGYVVSPECVESRGFFGRCRRLPWTEVTKVTLLRPWSYVRDIQVEAGRKKICFGVGSFWWRQGFFGAAEAIVGYAEIRGVPIKVKTGFGFTHEGKKAVDEWFDLGREGLFWWSKPQLPPRPVSSSSPDQKSV